jgi:hypothetical protein
MRAIRSAVVLTSLILAGTVAVAGGTKDPKDAKKGAPAAAGSGSGSAAPAPDPGPAAGNTPAPPTDLAAVKPEDMPTDVRMRRLEQKTQALKERAWQLKARVQMLKEQMLGGGVGAQAVITHSSDMGAAFRLTKLVYTLDGTQVFVRTDDTAETLYKTKSFDIFSGPISPGNHNINAVAIYKGHGYGVFSYLDKFTFTAKGSNAFIAGEGKVSRIECRGFERGGQGTPMEKRAAVDCKASQVMPDKAADAPKQTTPGTTPLPGK